MKGNDFEMNRKIKQILSLLLAAVIFVGVMPMSTVPASAATNGHSQSEAMAWLNSKIGIQIGNGQCPALAREYYSYLGYSVSGNGKDYENNVPNGWTRTYYYSGYVPQPGDIAVWRATNTDAGKIYGHVAIVQSATSSSMTCYEQGASANYKVRTHGYSYGMVTCFIRPDFTPAVKDTTAPQITDTFISCISETSFNVNATLYDENGIDHLWFVVYGPGGEYQFSESASNGYYYYTIFTSKFGGPGNYTVHMYAIDSSGNSSLAIFENISATKDTVAPQITNTFISCKNNDSFNINATLYDENNIAYLWFVVYGPGGEYQFSENASNGYYYYTIFTSKFGGPGNYTVHLYAFDPSGNSTRVYYDNINTIDSFNVYYNLNGGTGSIENQTKIHGENLTLSSVKPIGKSFAVNYNANGGSVSASGKTVSQTFTNWNTAKNGSGKSYLPGAIYSDNANLTLYAQYSNPSVGTLPTPTRSDYTFDGWYTAKDGGTKVSDSLKVTANITLYAHWTKIEQHIPTVKSVKIDDNAEINYKSSYKISSEITAESGAEYTAEWQSSNPKVASVDKNGKVTALKKGTAKITCTVTDSYGNTVSDTCNVTVKYSFGQWLIIILLFGWIWYI